MKALVCREHGLPDKLDLVDDWPEPEVGENDVLIDIKAASLNFPDVLIIQGKYQFQPDLPFVPGGECAGEIVAVGSAVDRFKPGDKVISIGGAGCFCERIAANEFSVFPMPEGLSYEQAAGVAMTYFTSYYALKQRGNLQPGETLLVLGAAGGVGSTAVELGKQMGAKVIAAASSEQARGIEQVNDAIAQMDRMDDDLGLDTIETGAAIGVYMDAGRMEYGPRALGNRSILYHCADPSVNDWLNQQLGRTEFMPFAPMCLYEDADEYFELRPGEKRPCEFMTLVVGCKQRMKDECPAAVHVDGTARRALANRARPCAAAPATLVDAPISSRGNADK